MYEVAQLKLALVCFRYFWKDKPLLILDLFISEYLDQIASWKEIKEAFSGKLEIENLCIEKPALINDWENIAY